MNIRKQTFYSFIVMILFLNFVIACSNSEDLSQKIEKITSTERIFTIDDLTKTGFKKNKTNKT